MGLSKSADYFPGRCRCGLRCIGGGIFTGRGNLFSGGVPMPGDFAVLLSAGRNNASVALAKSNFMPQLCAFNARRKAEMPNK